MANSRAKAATALRVRSLATKAGTSGVGHSRVVAAGELLPLGEKVLEMATPCGGILARTQALGLGGVENALNTTAKAGRGLRLVVQIGLSTARTSSVVIASTGMGRNGAAYSV